MFLCERGFSICFYWKINRRLYIHPHISNNFLFVFFQSYRQLEKIDGELRNMRNNVQERENQVALLKRIREIKLHTNTVKKIYHFGYQPGNMQNKGIFINEYLSLNSITCKCCIIEYIIWYLSDFIPDLTQPLGKKHIGYGSFSPV